VTEPLPSEIEAGSWNPPFDAPQTRDQKTNLRLLKIEKQLGGIHKGCSF
jgi:hypothetical protein